MNMSNALVLSLVVLLPLIPAYVLYRFLSSEANVEGPLHGLKFKLGGAFAAYFILFIALSRLAVSLPTYDVWTVRGQLAYPDEGEIFDDNLVRFVVKPPGVALHPDGRFQLTLFRVPDPSGEYALPTVIIDRDGYTPVVLDLDRGRKIARKRQVLLEDTVTLRRKPDVALHEDH